MAAGRRGFPAAPRAASVCELLKKLQSFRLEPALHVVLWREFLNQVVDRPASCRRLGRGQRGRFDRSLAARCGRARMRRSDWRMSRAPAASGPYCASAASTGRRAALWRDERSIAVPAQSGDRERINGRRNRQSIRSGWLRGAARRANARRHLSPLDNGPDLPTRCIGHGRAARHRRRYPRCNHCRRRHPSMLLLDQVLSDTGLRAISQRSCCASAHLRQPCQFFLQWGALLGSVLPVHT